MTSACMGEREEVQEDGLVRKHAYSVLSVHEFMHLETIQKLVRLRNPWGKTEWKLEWADGTKEWTDELRQKLSHKDKNDGVFFMPYIKYLDKFFDITISADPDWSTYRHSRVFLNFNKE